MKQDTEIHKHVIEELGWDPSITHEHISVAVDDGIVTLSGTVPSYAEKIAAEKATQRVGGVKGVIENIDVNLLGIHARSDNDLAHAAVEALKWNVQVPDEKIKVSVRNGNVTLTGECEWEFQKMAAENSLRILTGVLWIFNDISIKSKLNPINVREKIEEALKRTADEAVRQIRIQTDGGKVILSGRVHSFSESREARNAAFNAPGVTAVENKLQVSA